MDEDEQKKAVANVMQEAKKEAKGQMLPTAAEGADEWGAFKTVR